MSDEGYMKALEAQRKNFESQFGTLESMGFEDNSKIYKETSSDSEVDDFEGFSCSGESDGAFNSDSGNENYSEDYGSGLEENSHDEEEHELVRPKVIKLSDEYTTKNNRSATDKKILKGGRVLNLTEIEKKEKAKEKQLKKQNKSHSQEDADNLENDLKLQRLLEESHILSRKVEYSGVDTTLQTIDLESPVGVARKRTLNARLRNISSTNSATKGEPKRLEKMPMSMRKGMIETRKRKIAKYEQDAKDAGIILAKVKKGHLRDINVGKGSTPASDRLGTGVKSSKKHRDKGLKINSIGRSTRNGLVISQEEINRIKKPSRFSKGRRSK